MKYGTLPHNIMCSLLICSLLLIGCGGQAANPVSRYMLGDELKSTQTLKSEVSNIDDEIAATKKSKTDRDIWNIIFIATGIFVIFPFFFMDVKGSHEAEIKALKARKQQLMILYHQQGGDPAGLEESK